MGLKYVGIPYPPKVFFSSLEKLLMSGITKCGAQIVRKRSEGADTHLGLKNVT